MSDRSDRPENLSETTFLLFQICFLLFQICFLLFQICFRFVSDCFRLCQTGPKTCLKQLFFVSDGFRFVFEDAHRGQTGLKKRLKVLRPTD